MYPTAISSHTVRASAALTASYVAGTVFSAAEHNLLGIVFNYTKGDETSAQLKIEVSNNGGTTYAQQIAESTSGGTITVSLAERTFTATGIYAINIHPVRGQLIKISVKATGGTPTGTAAVNAYTAWA